jgi:hypothetical protein
MAIAFVGASTLSANTGGANHIQAVPLPTGHAAGNLLLLVITSDSIKTATVPAGWARVFGIQAGTSSASPFAAYPTTVVYYKIDSGSEGSSVSVNFPTDNWPQGDAYTATAVLAYSGTDQTSPVGEWGWFTTQSTAASQAHPIVTTSTTGEWLLTIRAVSTQGRNPNFTVSGGTNAERADFGDGQNELAMALYDSNGSLTAGAQTQRTTVSSTVADWGSNVISLAVRVPTPSIAQGPTATAAGTAYGATVHAVDGPWDLCAALPSYTFAVDWAGDGSFTTPGDDVTSDILDGGVTIAYGRDDNRQLSPPKTGNAAFSLNNTDRTYSPENAAGPLYGDLDPARECQGSVTFYGQTYPLMFQRVDDFTVHADMDDRTVDFTFLDGLNLLSGVTLSTDVQSGQRTGALINYVLDLAGWTGGRDIDPGVTIVPWWWVEGTDALSAINDLVKSDGPPSVAYVSPDNTFVFRDRHHRLLDEKSVNVQAVFSGNKLMDCTSPSATGLNFSAPFDYENGWKNIVNSVSFTVSERSPDTGLTAVWTNDSTLSLSTGQSVTLTVSGGDPFINAVTPVVGTDYVLTGSGTAQIQLSRTSGQSVTLSILAVGSPITISGLQVRAQAIAVRNTIIVGQDDAGSISAHGQKSYTDTAPWAGVNDAFAVAEAILLHYAKRRPTVSLRISAKNGAHLVQILSRSISDRIHIVNGEMGIDDDFFIENVAHTIQRMNNSNGQPPVHSVVFGCEKEVFVTANPFRFDVRGAGFDQGVFDQIGSSDPTTVFVFGDTGRGVFDFGTFGL